MATVAKYSTRCHPSDNVALFFYNTTLLHRETSPPLAQTNAVVESLANSSMEGVSGSPPFTLVCLSGWLASYFPGVRNPCLPNVIPTMTLKCSDSLCAREVSPAITH